MARRQPANYCNNKLHGIDSFVVKSITKPKVELTSDVVEYLTKNPKKLKSAVNTSSLSKINWSELPTKLMNFAKRIK
jgi:hypothetical protein